jgi:hypothetical protein
MAQRSRRSSNKSDARTYYSTLHRHQIERRFHDSSVQTGLLQSLAMCFGFEGRSNNADAWPPLCRSCNNYATGEGFKTVLDERKLGSRRDSSFPVNSQLYREKYLYEDDLRGSQKSLQPRESFTATSMEDDISDDNFNQQKTKAIEAESEEESYDINKQKKDSIYNSATIHTTDTFATTSDDKNTSEIASTSKIDAIILKVEQLQVEIAEQKELTAKLKNKIDSKRRFYSQ